MLSKAMLCMNLLSLQIAAAKIAASETALWLYWHVDGPSCGPSATAKEPLHVANLLAQM